MSADDAEADGAVLVPGVQDLVNGEFDAVGGAGDALDVAFVGAAGAAQVVRLAALLNRRPTLLEEGGVESAEAALGAVCGGRQCEGSTLPAP
ncbi:hypothetical protein [Streptomyces sp. enrichment culture]|uniref:hypothetical protein n=1 Tax=Streptomyces sp. enrichment culture TaxID=1795815 RepID=UPI003F56D403